MVSSRARSCSPQGSRGTRSITDSRPRCAVAGTSAASIESGTGRRVVEGQATFPRAVGSTWAVRVAPPPSSSATFDRVECTSSNSTVTKNPANPSEVSIALGAGDVVTCTYTNNVVFSAGLHLSKITTGGAAGSDRERERRVAGVTTHRARHIERTTHRGIPITTVPRTLVDLAAHLPLDALARACHEAGSPTRRRHHDARGHAFDARDERRHHGVAARHLSAPRDDAVHRPGPDVAPGEEAICTG